MYSQALRVSKNKLLLLFGILQITLGALAITFGSFSLTRACYLGEIAQGIWVGSFLVLTGIFGIVAYFQETTGWIETYLWTSAVSILLSSALVTLETVAYTVTFTDCRSDPSMCDVTCLSYHRYLMGAGELLQAASIGAVILSARTLRKPDDTTSVPYEKTDNGRLALAKGTRHAVENDDHGVT